MGGPNSSPNRTRPVATSDVLSQRQGREHPLRREAMPVVTDQLSVLLARQGSAVHAVTLGRHGGTFTARQKQILRATQPFLATAVSRSRRVRHQALQISPAPVRWVPADSAPGVDGVRGARAGDHLSVREREVLGLVAQGLTDARSTRLGVANRAAAVRLPAGCVNWPPCLILGDAAERLLRPAQWDIDDGYGDGDGVRAMRRIRRRTSVISSDRTVRFASSTIFVRVVALEKSRTVAGRGFFTGIVVICTPSVLRRLATVLEPL